MHTTIMLVVDAEKMPSLETSYGYSVLDYIFPFDGSVIPISDEEDLQKVLSRIAASLLLEYRAGISHVREMIVKMRNLHDHPLISVSLLVESENLGNRWGSGDAFPEDHTFPEGSEEELQRVFLRIAEFLLREHRAEISDIKLLAVKVRELDGRGGRPFYLNVEVSNSAKGPRVSSARWG